MSQLLEQLNSENSIPSPPGVALEIIRLNQCEDTDIDDLANVVVRDPAIVAKLLRMANSSNFGRPGLVSDINQAIMTLGLRSVNLLALSFSLVSYSNENGDTRFDYRKHWTASAATTTASHILVKQHLPKLTDEAFLASILCDFGQLILVEGATARYRPVLKRLAKTNMAIEVAEREVLGGDHAEVGGELLRSWGLPPLICSAIKYHHDPNNEANSDPDTRELARVLHAASLIGSIYSGGDISSSLEQLQAVTSEFFGMDSSACQQLLEATKSEMGEMVDMLGLECTEPAEIASILLRATEHLVRHSLALDQQINAVSADSAELKKRNDTLEQRATTDALTGLRNRGYFDEWLESERERASQMGHALGLLMADVDHFKSVNDDHGHPCGDELLKAVSSAVREVAGPDNIVCRYGGEEIAIIAPGHGREQLASLAENVRVAVAGTAVTHEGEPVSRTVSIGGYASREGATPGRPQQMLELADTELYRAKSKGRDRIFIASD